MFVIARFVIFVFAVLTFSVQIASAAPGGGVDGGGGGGPMVPSQDEDGPSLMRLFKQGVAFLAEGECKKAEEKFERVLKKVPRNSEANYLRGICFQCMDRHKSSIRYFQRAKRDDAQFYQAYGALGISFLAIDRPDRAREELAQLAEFKRLCEKANQKCPPELLKAHEKLATAIERAEGALVAPEKKRQRKILFDSKASQQPRN